MKTHSIAALLACGMLLLVIESACAAPVDELLQQYGGQGGRNFSAAAGEQFWDRQVTDAKSGEQRRCSLCHSTDLRRVGKHATTGKAIEPLAPSANPQRLTDKEKIEKWLLRNCKWTLGRECTAQEKGDVLVFIRGR
jgi:hypothetical protein